MEDQFAEWAKGTAVFIVDPCQLLSTAGPGLLSNPHFYYYYFFGGEGLAQYPQYLRKPWGSL